MWSTMQWAVFTSSARASNTYESGTAISSLQISLLHQRSHKSTWVLCDCYYALYCSWRILKLHQFSCYKVQKSLNNWTNVPHQSNAVSVTMNLLRCVACRIVTSTACTRQCCLSGWTDNNNNKRQTWDITLPAQKPCSITALGQPLVCYLPLPVGCCVKSRLSHSRLLPVFPEGQIMLVKQLQEEGNSYICWCLG